MNIFYATSLFEICSNLRKIVSGAAQTSTLYLGLLNKTYLMKLFRMICALLVVI